MLCKNHPDTATKRRCFQCKDAICNACTLRLDKHYFCSPTCHETWVAVPRTQARVKKHGPSKRRKPRKTGSAAALPPVSPYAPPEADSTPLRSVAPAPSEKPAQRTSNEERKSNTPLVIRQQAEGSQRPWLAALIVVNVLVLSLVGLLFWRTEKRAAQAPVENGWTYLADLNKIIRVATAPDAAPEITEAPLETTAATLVVEGSQPAGASALRLFLNGKETGTVERTGDRFRTPPLPLEFGLNVLQVAAENEPGEPLRYSLARVVRRIDAPPQVEQTSLALKLRLPSADITRGNPTRNAVSFTFDGGSEANAAAEILEILRKQGVHTTLFLTGQFMQRNPEVVKQAVQDGHEIGNHTFNHPHLTTFEENNRHDLLPSVTKESFQKQLLDTAAEFRKLTGQEMAPFWRAPYGEVNPQLRQWAEELGYRHIGWSTHVGPVNSLDSLDWVDDKESRLYLSGRSLKNRFVDLVNQQTEAVRGGIFLMHLGTDRKTDKTHWQLAEILAAYKNKGFQIVPVSQLLQ
jgi:peptidoglycan/xylan/chitin deacetylase (PgdA/CDA1 family)